MKFKPLIAHQIPLLGKHLIEASAGTGKTYNITRLYLRLLLEQELTVEQILVMTFTKDATEELRGRIDNFIRYALNNWQTLITTDEFFIAIEQKVATDKAQWLLKRALLFLDQAAIFTIHGFCKSVLSQHAFSTGVAFNADMDTQHSDLPMTAVQDWYRQLASDSSEQFLMIAEFWPTPVNFLNHFNRVIHSDSSLQLISEASHLENFSQLVGRAISNLTSQQQQLASYLISGKSIAVQQQRQCEFDHLLQWLDNVQRDYKNVVVPMPDAFIDGRRFGRSPHKQLIKDIFEPVSKVKIQYKSLLKTIAKAKALTIVRQGIYQIRETLTQHKLSANILTFDDLITRLHLKLRSDAKQHLAQTLYTQFPVALVDEFQDTDPKQFAIIKALYFDQKQAGLFMIGDPKQAIYGFRGGDVFAYLSARKDCDHCWLMDTNWRSSDTMIAGYNRLFVGDSQGQSPTKTFAYGIEYFAVKAAVNASQKQLLDSQYAPLQFVHFSSEDKPSKVSQDYRKVMATWCANEITRLLNATDHNNIQARDIALLVRDGGEALDIKTALSLAGLPSVYLSNKSNLLDSEQSKQLLQLLKGILLCENDSFFSAAVACQLLPYSVAAFYQLKQDQLAWQGLQWQFQQLRELWQSRGFITMALQLMHQHMCITGDNTDRVLTNLLHLFELLQSASQRHRQPQQLYTWFEQQIHSNNADTETELRLESEDNLIRIVTQHGSKGLEYPIVFIPFATRHKNPLKAGNSYVSVIEYHDSNGQLITSLDGSDQAKQTMAEEAYAESIRLLYVAVTRAEKRCYLLTTAFEHYHLSPLGQTMKMAAKSDIYPQLQLLAAELPDAIGAELIDQPLLADSYHQQPHSDTLSQVAQFSGSIERDWWLSSFTALSRNIRNNGLSTPDRDNETINLATAEENPQPTSLLRFELPKGANSGNLLHNILERVNFSQPDWQPTLDRSLLQYGQLPNGFSEQELINWLNSVLDCPLDNDYQSKSNSGGWSAHSEQHMFNLSSLSAAQTMREAEFYYPLKQAKTEQLAILLTDHRNRARTKLGADRNPALTPSQLQLTLAAQLNGMMHGYIDLIFEYQGKYYLADYKSNYLGSDHQDYQTQQMQINIETHHYDLQYLIYALALHRYLASAITDYQVEQHFGGVYYLYLRGMSSEQKHRGCGVYFQAITAAELAQLDQLFSGQAVLSTNTSASPIAPVGDKR